MLNWPIRWSSLHGIAIITTPVLKIVTSSDALAETVIVDRNGPIYPDEGATGVDYPFRATRPIQLQTLQDTWSDNGFASFSAMEASHNVILRAIDKTFLGVGTVLDIGCGNGLLLEKISNQFHYLSPAGVEMEEDRYKAATARLGGRIIYGNVYSTIGFLGGILYELVLISVNRLIEVEREQAELLVKQLRDSTRYLIVYTYDGWKQETDKLLLENFDFFGSEYDGQTSVQILKPK